jgi:mevalonate kinase
MAVTASAPGKIMLFGEHAVVYGHPCIVTAVDQRVFVTVEKNGEDVLHLEAPDLGLMAYSKTIKDLGGKDVPKAVAFVEMLYKRFLMKYPQDRGIIVKTRSDFSSSFGFGSSSAVTVAFAKALLSLYEIEMSNKELFDLCYAAVLDVQGVGSGFDLAAAIWGGTIFYEPPARIVEQVDIDGMAIIVGYTGVKADTATIVRMVGEMRRQEPIRVNGIMEEIAKISNEARQAIVDRDWEFLGTLMQQNQMLLRQLDVSTAKLEALIKVSQKAGAWGAKLSGAGGGDCMIAMAHLDKREAVETALRQAQGEPMRVVLGAEGARIEQ